MLEFVWFILACIPFVIGLTFVMMGTRERWQRSAVQERPEPGRR